MAISRVQHANNGGDNGVLTVTTSPTTAGNCLAVLVTWNITGVSITSITDNATGGSNTYIQAPNSFVSLPSGGGRNGAAYYAKNIRAAATTITVTLSGSSSQISIMVFEYSGVDTANPVDDSNHNSGNVGTITSPTLTLSKTGDVMVDGIFSLGGGVTTASPATATLVDNFFSSWGSIEDFPASSGLYSNQSGNSGSQDWFMVSMALKTPAAGPSSATKTGMNLVF